MKRAFLIVIIVLILCNTGCSSPWKTKTYDNEVTYILLSNIGDITFKQAELNSGISSNSRDYFFLKKL